MKQFYEEWKKLTLKKNLSGQSALAAVNQDGHVLQYVKDQTKEICLAAVKQNGYVLQYVEEQTEEICLAAVKRDGGALRYVKEEIFTKDSILVEANGKQVYISKESATALGLI